MNIFDFVNAAKALTTDEEVVALVDKFIAEHGPVSLAELRTGLEEVIGGRLICDDKVYLTHMGNFVRQVKNIPIVQIPEDHALGNVQFAPRRMKGMNADFDGVTPGVDQLIHDAMNAKGNAETAGLIHPGQQEQMDMRGENLDLDVLDQSCLTSQCLTDKGRAALGESKYPFKLTDMHGDRGVICKVIPDDQLPLDKEGNRPEIVINDSPCFKLPTSLVGPRSLWNSLSGKEVPEGFNVTVPTLMEGDVYHRTHVTDDNRVLHIAHDPAGNQAIYVCTQNGNSIMREVITKDYDVRKHSYVPVTKKYIDGLAYENLTKNSN